MRDMTPADDAAPRQEPEPLDDGEGGYRLAGWDEKAHGTTEPPTDNASAAVLAGETPAPQAETGEPSRRPPLPARPFLTGTFSFPLSWNARFYGLYLTIGAMVVLRLAAQAVGFGETRGLQSWLFSALLWPATVILGTMWLTFASGCALAVVRDTANGLTKVGSWPALDVLEYLMDPLYLFNSVCVSVLPGVALGWVLAHYGFRGGAAGPISGFLLFPIVLLSMLEHGSPMGIVSGPVLRTFALAARGWGAFYLASALLLVAAGCSAAAALLGIENLLGAFLAAVVVAAAWLIYFRLLGRLAWYCAEHMPPAEPEDEPEDEDAEDLHVQEVEMVPVTYVFCSRCGKRVEVGRVPVGAQVVCAYCGLGFAVGHKLGRRGAG
jgi:hypothetical protein